MVMDPPDERPGAMKARVPTVARALGISKLTVERNKQDLKASTPTLITVLGIVIATIPDSRKALPPILVNTLPASKVTEVREEHW